MNSIALETAIGTRIVAALSGEVAVQGVWSEVAPNDASGSEIKPTRGGNPIVLFSLAGAESDHTEVNYQFDVEYEVRVIDSRDNGTTNAKAAWERIIGNGKPGTPGTYGLSRWKPTVSGYNVTTSIFEGFRYEHDADHLVYVASFSFHLGEA
jgi:hypothetical protein